MEHRKVLTKKASIDDVVRLGEMTLTVERDAIVLRMKPPEGGIRLGNSVLAASYANGYMRFLIDAPADVRVTHEKAGVPDE